MSTLQMPGPVFEAMRRHGEEAYPHECCGALLGHALQAGSWRIVAAVRAGNTRTDSAHNRYQIAPLELVHIERNARKQGLDIAGFYHSHPDHPAQWSPTDFAEAHWLGCAYVITEVRGGKAATTNAFLLAGPVEEDKHFQPMTIEVEDIATKPK